MKHKNSEVIKLIVKRPKSMESKIFLKAMLIFPEKISKSYDSKVMNSVIAYRKLSDDDVKVFR